MKKLDRIYDALLRRHGEELRQMAFLSGPRQVGKSTSGAADADLRLNWDDPADRRVILRGPAAVADALRLDRATETRPGLLLDELHKFRRWKEFLKGFFDVYGDRVRIVVTGSARMDLFRRGGDSLMGRYFPYRMHPLSVAEIITTALPDGDLVRHSPAAVDAADYEALCRHGGFPEPYLRRSDAFTRRWRRTRRQQLVREDIRDLTRVQEIGQLDTLLQILEERSGSQVNLSNLAREVQTSVDTCRRWLVTLQTFYAGFLVRPWHRNVARALRKEPKWYLRDWSGVEDAGARHETFLACHLLKAVEGWTDLGLGDFELRYLRDKEKREVDFVVIRDRKPWLLVEAKVADERPSGALGYFQEVTGAPFAVQVTREGPVHLADAFVPGRGPVTVTARAFLSQLL